MLKLPQHIVDCAEFKTAASRPFRDNAAFLVQIFWDGVSEFAQSKSFNSSGSVCHRDEMQERRKDSRSTKPLCDLSQVSRIKWS